MTKFFIDEIQNEYANEDEKHKEDKRLVKDLWNIFLRKKQKSAGSFIERLNKYSTVVFEKHSSLYDDFVKNCYFLEDKWTDVITENVLYTKKIRLQQQAIWEFFVTERNYIKKLRVIVEVFQQYFKLCQSEGDLLDINQSQLFSNISEVLLSNDNLWNNHLRHVLSKTRESNATIKPSLLLASFNKLEVLFRPYVKFCLHQDACLKYLRELTEPATDIKNDNSKNFKEYLAWCETLPQCERFKLRDLMTEPMQRMTRYPLLLKKIKKETEDPTEKQVVSEMIVRTERFISSINTALRKKFENEKLETCLQQFEYYTISKAASEEVKWTAIEFLKTKIQCLPTEEQRCILKKGTMKLYEKKGKGDMDITAFLFTDVLVLTKLKRSTNQFQIIRQLFFLDKITLVKSQSSNGGIVFIYLDEYGLLASTFMIEVNEDERDSWIATIERAKVRYENAKAGEGSTLDFFHDDYYIPIHDNNGIDLKDTQAQFRSHAHYESTIDRVESRHRELSSISNERYTTFKNDLKENNFKPNSLTNSISEEMSKDWALSSVKRKSLPVRTDGSRVCESFRSNKSDTDLITCNKQKDRKNWRSQSQSQMTRPLYQNRTTRPLSQDQTTRFLSQTTSLLAHDPDMSQFQDSNNHDIQAYKNTHNGIRTKMSVGPLIPDPLYEEIGGYLQTQNPSLHDANNNKCLRHVLTSQHSTSDSIYFKSESTQTSSFTTSKNSQHEDECTQTDITFSSNMFALAKEDYLADG